MNMHHHHTYTCSISGRCDQLPHEVVSTTRSNKVFCPDSLFLSSHLWYTLQMKGINLTHAHPRFRMYSSHLWPSRHRIEQKFHKVLLLGSGFGMLTCLQFVRCLLPFHPFRRSRSLAGELRVKPWSATSPDPCVCCMCEKNERRRS